MLSSEKAREGKRLYMQEYRKKNANRYRAYMREYMRNYRKDKESQKKINDYWERKADEYKRMNS